MDVFNLCSAQESLRWVRISLDHVAEEESVREGKKRIKQPVPMHATREIILRKELERVKIG